MLNFASDSRVDVENRDLIKETMLFIMRLRNWLYVLPAFVDGHRRQTLFSRM